jgi:hypothetical protein
MNVVVKFSEHEEPRALAILLRHSPGTMLPDRTYVISEEAARALSQAGVPFTRLAGERNPPSLSGAVSGERV